MQRVAAELAARLDLPFDEVAPGRPLGGAAGHAWEQAVLPWRRGGAPLWSPCNTGPLAVRAQVVTLHDAAVFDRPEWFTPAFVRTYRFLWPRLARRARRIVAVSEDAAARLARALDLPLAGIEVVANGVSPHFAPRPAEEVARAAARHGVVPGRYFATLSTLEPRKNLALVLAAWEGVRAQLPPETALLLIGGAGVQRIFGGAGGAERDLPGVRRSGFVPDQDLPALLGGAIGLLYPSRYEGFGLPPLEAMASGTPAIVSNVTSLPEVCGSAALYVDPDDRAALAHQMLRLAREPALRADLSAAGRARAAAFSWDGAAARMREILRRDLDL